MSFDLGKYLIQYSYLLGFFAAFFVLREKLDFSSVGKNTMGIYLLHMPVIMKITSLVAMRLTSNGLLSLFLIFLSCFTISWQMTNLINRIPHGKILFGMR